MLRTKNGSDTYTKEYGCSGTTAMIYGPTTAC